MEALYTGRGDGGYTQTISEKRISKADLLIDLIGTTDEASAALGLARAYGGGECVEDINWLLDVLSEVMGELAGGKKKADSALLSELEKRIDLCSVKFEGFTMPGENLLSAQLNMARCIIRRAERIAVRLLEAGRISRGMEACLNRMSDLIYAMSRCAEKQ